MELQPLEIEKYHPFIRIIHWLMFIAFAVIFVLGFVMLEYKDCEPWTLYEIHKSTGVLVFLLVWIRLIARWQTAVPALPPEYPDWVRNIAHGTTHLMYLLMIIIPISGYAVSNVNGYGVKFYGIPLPDLFPKNLEIADAVENFHFYSAYLFLGLIVLHILGVIFHHVQKQEILRRMT